MRILSVLLLAPCLLIVASAGGQEKKGEGKDDLELFQGSWKIVSWATGSENSVPEETLEGWKFIFNKEKYDLKASENNSEDGTFKIDPKAKPKHMELNIKSGNDDGKRQLGLYEFENANKLKICFALPGAEDRPKEIAAKDDPVTMVIILEREKAK
ncbi:MAG: TIGR03067 domain-containing protein [Planctomycetes bacterium]|nr:TIGR03067 domain-containing protein [Planctomycetota bacterium]